MLIKQVWVTHRHRLVEAEVDVWRSEKSCDQQAQQVKCLILYVSMILCTEFQLVNFSHVFTGSINIFDIQHMIHLLSLPDSAYHRKVTQKHWCALTKHCLKVILSFIQLKYFHIMSSSVTHPTWHLSVLQSVWIYKICHFT